uniref:G_PROTEIN_RECEP_F1_2 domain-containing protein n=1 Tax=Panagrellus redivivus TaxID=6233 RepID=A0A7E5A0K3_PANRE
MSNVSAENHLLGHLELAELLVSYIGIAFNVILLYLVWRHTAVSVSPYKPILYQNCIADIIYAVCVIIVRPLLDTEHEAGWLLIRPPIPYESKLITMLLIIWYKDFTFLLYVTLVPVQFVYRYIYIVKNIKISKAMHLGMLCAALFCCELASISCYMIVNHSEEYVNNSVQVLMTDPAYQNLTNVHIIATTLLDIQQGTLCFLIRTPIPYESNFVTTLLAIWYDTFGVFLYIALVIFQFMYRIFIVYGVRITKLKLLIIIYPVIVFCGLNLIWTSLLAYRFNNSNVTEKPVLMSGRKHGRLFPLCHLVLMPR